MRKDPLEMPVGVYINNLIQSYYEATTLVEDAEQDVLSQQIEGQDAEDWIQQNAIDETKKAMAICSEFNARNHRLLPGAAAQLPGAGSVLL